MKKIVVGMATVAVVGLSSAFLTESVHANTVSDLETKQEKVADDRSAVKEKLSKADAEIADVLFDIKELNQEIEKTESALKANEKALDKTATDIKKTEEKIEVLEKRIEERTEKLKERIASYQQNGGDIAYLDVLFGARDFSEFISRVSAVTTITNADAKLVEEQEEDKAEVEVKINELEDKKSDLEANEKKIKEDKEKVENSKNAAQEKEKDLKELKAGLESEDSSLAALEDQIRQDINTTNNPVETASSESGSLTTLASSNSNSSKSKAKKPASSAPAYTGGGGSAISAGQQFVGKTTYVFGAKNPGAGQFDCSGFVSWAYEQEGVSLPRDTGGQSGTGTKISYSQAKAGDLVFFDTYKKNGHVGIYLGGGKFLGAQSSTGVAVANMSSGYWKDNFSGHVRRVK